VFVNKLASIILNNTNRVVGWLTSVGCVLASECPEPRLFRVPIRPSRNFRVVMRKFLKDVRTVHRTPNSTLFDLLPNFYLNSFWYATSESVGKKRRVKGEISEKKLIKDTENSLLLIDVHVKLQCIFFLQIFGGDPHFS